MTLFENSKSVWTSVAKRGATLLLMILATVSMASSCDDCDDPECCEASETDGGTDTEGPVDQQPELLTDLDSLMTALNGGEDVRAVFYYSDCELNGTPGPDAVGGMAVETYEWFAEGSIGNSMPYVSFSKSSLVLLGNDYIYDYVKARVYSDGTVTLVVEYLDVLTYDVEMHEQFTCGINQSADDDKGASLYLQP